MALPGIARASLAANFSAAAGEPDSSMQNRSMFIKCNRPFTQDQARHIKPT